MIKQNGEAVRCRTVRRVPVEDRWSAADVLSVAGTPRYPAPFQIEPSELRPRIVDEEADVGRRERSTGQEEVAERRRADAEDPDSGANLQQPQARALREEDIRRFRITCIFLKNADSLKDAKSVIERFRVWLEYFSIPRHAVNVFKISFGMMSLTGVFSSAKLRDL